MTTRTLSPNLRKLLYGTLVFIVFYFVVRLISLGSLEIEEKDWGMDMGYTQLFWGMVLVVYILFLLYYFQQKRFRFTELDKAYLLFTSSTLFFLIGLFLFGGQFVLHDPGIDIYHLPGAEYIDKIGHFLAFAVGTVILLKIHPSRLALIVIFLFGLSYELFELVWIWELGQDAGMSFSSEINDVIPDVVANVMGIAIGYYYAIRYQRVRIVK